MEADHAIRVLLVDDHALFRAGLVEIFRARSRLAPDRVRLDIVAEAADGWNGVELTERLRPDVALLDILLPDMSGFEVARAVARRAPATRVVAVTGDPGAEQVPELLATGVRGYLSKMALPSELERAIRLVHAGGVYIQAEYAPAAAPTGRLRPTAHSDESDHSVRSFRSPGTEGVGAVATEGQECSPVSPPSWSRVAS